MRKNNTQYCYSGRRWTWKKRQRLGSRIHKSSGVI